MATRKNLRVDCYSSCLLNYEDTSYHAKLVNISLSGALISVDVDVLDILHVGDECALMLCDRTDACLAKYSCKVITQNSSKIGVNFQGMHT